MFKKIPIQHYFFLYQNLRLCAIKKISWRIDRLHPTFKRFMLWIATGTGDFLFDSRIGEMEMGLSQASE